MERMSQAILTATQAGEVVVNPPPPLSVEAEKLALRIERAIRRETSDKVRELKVEVRHSSIVIHGRCGTFYSKQLAQHAAMGLAEDRRLINQIDVW